MFQDRAGENTDAWEEYESSPGRMGYRRDVRKIERRKEVEKRNFGDFHHGQSLRGRRSILDFICLPRKLFPSLSLDPYHLDPISSHRSLFLSLFWVAGAFIISEPLKQMAKLRPSKINVDWSSRIIWTRDRNWHLKRTRIEKEGFFPLRKGKKIEKNGWGPLKPSVLRLSRGTYHRMRQPGRIGWHDILQRRR